ncbi:MAG: triphosphoribosyl-dephospho-CoA synthase [Planctomycetota bacterium]
MSESAQPPLSIGAKATLACLWEATAPKPGNVYRGADFADLTYADFAASAAAIGPVFDRVGDLSVGELTLQAVAATQAAVATNTNLGTVLLLAPLAKADRIDALDATLGGLTVEDAVHAYAAIRLAAPGGLGEVDDADVASAPAITLLEAMRLAADRDLIAAQFANGFTEVLATAEHVALRISQGKPLADAIVFSQLRLMAERPDTLIARKCGEGVAEESADRAAMALEAAEQDGDLRPACAELDFWLRADGHRRNPGATADVIAAGLFVLLMENRLGWPVDFYGRRSSRSG